MSDTILKPENEPIETLFNFYRATEKLRDRYTRSQVTNYQRETTEQIERLNRWLEAIQEQIDIKILEIEGARKW